ncbi:MAG: hypothetical protein WC859_01925 [Elusimicrobiota bacterium]|jgi:hypothetical protein
MPYAVADDQTKSGSAQAQTSPFNLLIVLSSRLYVRNFLESGALNRLADPYSCSVALAQGMDPSLLTSQFPFAGFISADPKRSQWNTFRMYLTMWAHRKRSTSYPLKFNVDISGRKRRTLYQILALPGLFQLTLFVIERLIGRNRSVDNLLDKTRPVMVVFPSQGTDLMALDVLAACRERKIQTFMLINGWDNLSTKGTMTDHPDILAVWGEESREHAARIQHIEPARIRVLGVPHFEVYRNTVPPEKISHIRAIHAIPADRKIIIFAGCSRDVAELDLLGELDRAMGQGTMSGYHVIYRPHPWGHDSQLETRFSDRHFRFITMDAQIREGHERVDRLGLGRRPDHFVPGLDYYPALMASAHCVISPLSTFLIESAVMGKPALAIAFSIGKTEFPLEQIYECEHFRYLRKTQAILTSHSRQAFVRDVQHLLELAEQPAIGEQLRQDIAPIVFRGPGPYADRLLAEIQALLPQGASHSHA